MILDGVKSLSIRFLMLGVKKIIDRDIIMFSMSRASYLHI